MLVTNAGLRALSGTGHSRDSAGRRASALCPLLLPGGHSCGCCARGSPHVGPENTAWGTSTGCRTRQSCRALLLSDAHSLSFRPGNDFGERVLRRMGSQGGTSRATYQNSSRDQGRGEGMVEEQLAPRRETGGHGPSSSQPCNITHLNFACNAYELCDLQQAT